MSNSPGEWYASLPPICKAWGTACVLITFGTQFGLPLPVNLYLDYKLIWEKFQIWRLIGNFCFIGGFGFPFVFRTLMIARYGVHLEQKTFENRTSDFVWMLMINMMILLPLKFIVPSVSQPFYSSSLIFAMLYLWSRENPTQNTSIMGMIRMPAFYLPWGMMALTVLMGGDPVPDFLGVLSGHVYYFFSVLYPRQSGVHFLKTPQWVEAAVGSVFGNPVIRAASNIAQPNEARRFVGRGRRLAD
ncbi:unnamed protein product [Bathycoccus prasinos]|jgi:Derlin-2/3|uniref:Derlin n=1 Tax=Bathycoccus prasinos TaxID=41875 RepID=K8FI38_9CHLO|nr:predicted protein [Bathycoccus prasinos]CCO66419.1 predicted protein [Bathycoccus prasinos]|tara:strand:+ start:133 stop:864 length:732 start_codon:yes stop_codon:yes gene_type:complete|eukprot:XP_007512331.1 predicted protein [Bathycoccus prasinos]